MLTPEQAWERFAHGTKPRRAVNSAGVSTWLNWTQYADHGPDESIMGDLRGRRVLELGSGSGANLAHLATLGAGCVGVDIAPTRTAVAQDTWGRLPNLAFLTADVATYLRDAPAFDIIFSIFGAVWFIDPAVLLPLVRRSLASDGVFAFSQLPLEDRESGRVVRQWNYRAEDWPPMLTDHGFDQARADLIAPPRGHDQATLLVQARA